MKLTFLRICFWISCLLGVVTNAVSVPALAATQAIFPVAPQITLTGESFLAFAGDINGNGATDLASYSITNAGVTLSIVLNAGSASPTTVNTQLGPMSNGQPVIRFADLNKDKKLDLVYWNNGYLTIQLGNGDGTFQTPAYFPAVSALPVVTDLNGDGFPDIAALGIASGNGPTQISIYLNSGSSAPGTFGNPTTYASPGSIGLQAGDFNGDGKTDLLTTVTSPASTSPVDYASSLVVFFGKGDGTVNPAKAQAAPFSLSSVTVADFNGDGMTDVALLPSSSGGSLYTSVQIELGSSSGNFTTGASVPILGSNLTDYNYSNALSTATLTSDGNLDLIVTAAVVNVFHGDGKGNFMPVTASYAPGYPGNLTLFADTNSDGKADMIVGDTSNAFLYAGNGDGTFQAPPAIPLSGPFADVNNDGIADILFLQYGAMALGTALGRGDGTFAILNQTAPLPTQTEAYPLIADMNGDGNPDAVVIQSGSSSPSPFACDDDTNSQLLVYLGNGHGTFQEKGTGLPLGVRDPATGILGDFNSDGKLDVIIPYNWRCQVSLLFAPGNGDGTFGSPVLMNVSQSGANTTTLLAGDLNNDKKLDFVWGGAVFLGNGDGTFKQIPLNIQPSSVIALEDLNGDGILDAVSVPGVIIYAGNGDGTFATTPFFNQGAPLLSNFFVSGKVDGNANPDLIPIGQSPLSDMSVLPYLGDGHGNFTADPNAYMVTSQQASTMAASAVRLNNQAPPAASDNTSDMLISVNSESSYTYTVSLLNQLNAAPQKPAPIGSSVILAASQTSAAPGATIALTATVVGTSPTGSVSFAANGKELGTEPVANGSAVLQTSFANAGSYAVTAAYAGDENNTSSLSASVDVTIGQATSSVSLVATPTAANVQGQITLEATVTGSNPTGNVTFTAGSANLGTAALAGGTAKLTTSFATAGSYAITAAYAGDANNAASVSSPVTVLVASPDFTISATPPTGTITAGQSATFTFTVTPSGGFASAVQFSCGTLPSDVTCTFAPSSVTPSGTTPATSTLTVTTMGAKAATNTTQPGTPSGQRWFPAGGLALAGAIGFFLVPVGRRRSPRVSRVLGAGWLLALLALALQGCGGGGSTPTNPGTPTGSYTISVNASVSAGGPQHAANISLKVQ